MLLCFYVSGIFNTGRDPLVFSSIPELTFLRRVFKFPLNYFLSFFIVLFAALASDPSFNGRNSVLRFTYCSPIGQYRRVVGV